MSWPQIGLTAYFDLPLNNPTLLLLDDPVQGLLNTFVLGGDIATDVTQYVMEISIMRGRSRTFDSFNAGTCVVKLKNRFREFDSLYTLSPFFGNVVPGKRMSVSVAGVTVFDGEVEKYRYTYDRNRVPICEVTLIDALGVLARSTFDEWIATSGQTVGQRLTSLLDRDEVRFGTNRDFDSGVFLLQGDTIPANTNALAYAQQVARSDFGRLFASRDGQLAFRDRLSGSSFVAEMTFDLDGQFPFVDVQRDTAGDLLINQVIAGRRGGSTAVFDNLLSQGLYGVRGLNGSESLTDLLLLNDSDAFDYGAFVVNSYGVPEERFASFSFMMNRFTGVEQAEFAALDIGSFVAGSYTPAGVGSSIDRDCVVEGFRHTIRRNGYVLDVFVGDAGQTSSFVFDDATFGVFDGPGLLAF